MTLLSDLFDSLGYIPEGYDDNTILTQELTGGFSGSNLDIDFGYGTELSDETVYVPPTKAIEGTPGVAATPATISYTKNKGWNTRARSVDIIEKGTYFDFTCSTGIEGCVVGLGPANQFVINILSFSHAIISDLHGIKIYENGSLVKTLKATQSSLSNIRIYRSTENYIMYVITTEDETLTYQSLSKNTIYHPYIYGNIYSGGDKILTASYNSGALLYGSV